MKKKKKDHSGCYAVNRWQIKGTFQLLYCEQTVDTVEAETSTGKELRKSRGEKMVALTRGPTVQKIVRSKTSRIPNGLSMGVTKFLARITEVWSINGDKGREQEWWQQRGYLTDQIYTSFEIPDA